MSDFNIFDLQSDRSIAADDGVEVTVFARPSGTRSFLVVYAGGDKDFDTLLQWILRTDGLPVSFTITEISLPSSGSGTVARIVDVLIPDGFTGVARFTVLLRANASSATFLRVVMRLIVMPFETFLDAAWLAPELFDLQWELRTNRVWSQSLAERAVWGLAPNNSQMSLISLREGSDVTFAVLPALAGALLTGTGDVTALSLTIRQADDAEFTADPLLTVAATLPGALIDAGGGNKYYALATTLSGDAITAAFADIDAAPEGVGTNRTVMWCVAELKLTHDSKIYVSRSIPFLLEQALS